MNPSKSLLGGRVVAYNMVMVKQNNSADESLMDFTGLPTDRKLQNFT